MLNFVIGYYILYPIAGTKESPSKLSYCFINLFKKPNKRPWTKYIKFWKRVKCIFSSFCTDVWLFARNTRVSKNFDEIGGSYAFMTLDKLFQMACKIARTFLCLGFKPFSLVWSCGVLMTRLGPLLLPLLLLMARERARVQSGFNAPLHHTPKIKRPSALKTFWLFTCGEFNIWIQSYPVRLFSPCETARRIFC